MDKNFVNIDNLVRHRLGGGEEQEQAGAWQNMRELLDKEMPQEKPVGLFYWRRMLSAIAVLVLVTTIGIGGYKMASSVNGDHNANISGITATPTAATPGSMTPAASNGNDGSSLSIQEKEQANTPTDNAGNNEVNNQQLIVANNVHSANENKVTNTPKTNKQAVSNIVTPANNKMPTANDKQAGGKNVVASASGNVAVNNVTANADKKAAKTKNASKATSRIDTKINGKSSATPEVAITKNNQPANNETTAKDKTTASNKTNTTANVTGPNSNTKPVNSKENKAGAVAHSNDKVAAKSNMKTANEKIAKVGVDKKQTVTPDKMALGGHASSAKSINAIDTKNIDAKPGAATMNKVSNPNTKDVNGGKSVADADKKVIPATAVAPNVPMFTTKSGKKIPGDKLQRLNLDRARKNRSADATAEVNPLKSKRVIQKMALVEHLVTSPTGEKSYKLDTLSMVTLTEELGIITETKTTIPANSGSGNVNSSTKNKGAAAPVILPAASSSKSHTSVTEEATPSKMTNGSKSMENLSAAFNDIKYHIAGMQFAPGLMAGINATFFGPNSFKGFQFGFAGNFIFSEKLGLMTELKYFHRINNNYDISDNYYTYTPTSGGYSKELEKSSYSFSTLHSFELPVALRFTEQKFNFFAGGNFVYSFSVNTGAASLADPNNTTITTTIGNDNAPKLSANDFNFRFGIGYLFGASYMLSPNCTIDMRTVQTLWDNSRSAGAKEVSSQLYKSPSLQVSFGYRLGGNKNK